MIKDEIYQQAAYWLTRQNGEGMDWDGFTCWLEAEPSHRAAYDELALIDIRLDEYGRLLADAAKLGERGEGQSEKAVRLRQWARLGGGTIAAAVALILALQWPTHQLPVRDYRSPDARNLRVVLENGAQIDLAPATQLRVQGNRMVLRGTAYFNVRHDPREPLAISAGAFKVTDIGTRFSIQDDANGVAIDVAQGSIVVTSAALASPIAISGGHGLRADGRTQTVRLINVDPEQVAGWRTGRLQFDGVPLALVVQDISHYSGQQVTVDPAIADQPFSGVITISHGEAPAQTVAQILSLRVRNVDGGLRLEPRRS